MLWEAVFKECFFLNYHLPGVGNLDLILKMPIRLRKWYIKTFHDQKELENREIEKQKNAAKNKR